MNCESYVPCIYIYIYIKKELLYLTTLIFYYPIYDIVPSQKNIYIQIPFSRFQIISYEQFNIYVT